MTPSEFEGWWSHFTRYPPAEQILASLWFGVMKALGGTPEIQHMGFWLDSPEARAARELKQKRAERAARVRMTAAAYERSARVTRDQQT